MSYDFTKASDFLNEIETSPEELYAEIVDAMATVSVLKPSVTASSQTAFGTRYSPALTSSKG